MSYYSIKIQKHPGWSYRGVYADEALTGTKEHRPEFQRLLADCRAGLIDMMTTKSISRLARNTVTLLATIRELKALGVDVFFEKENIHSMGGDGELMLTILASYAQEESRSVSENCKWRIRRNYERGAAIPLPTFGYSIVEGNPEINPDEVKVVRMIFEKHLQGIGLWSIARMLDSLGIKPPYARRWGANTIRYILRNELYVGDLLLQKKFTVDFLTKTSKINEGEVQPYYVEGSHAAVAMPELFDTVQVEMKRRKESGRRNVAPHCFSGRIFCDECGSLYGSKVWNAGTPYKKTVWQCNAKSHGDTICHTHVLRPEEIKRSFVQAINRIVDNKAEIVHAC